MRDVSLWNEVLGVEKTVFESVGARPGAGPVGGSDPAHETGAGSLRSVPAAVSWL